METRLIVLKNETFGKWRGIYRGNDVVCELIPGIFEASLEDSNLCMRVPTVRISAEISNNSYDDPDGESVICFGPSRFGKSVVGFGRPRVCPLDSLLMVAIQGDEVSEDVAGECAYLIESTIADHLESGDTVYTAALSKAYAIFYKALSDEFRKNPARVAIGV